MPIQGLKARLVARVDGSTDGLRIILRRVSLACGSAGIVVALIIGCAGASASSNGAIAVYSSAAPTHIPTWAFDDGCNGGGTASSTLVRRWLTFAYNNCGPTATKALGDCHSQGLRYCDVMQYMDTDWDYGDEPLPPLRAAPGNWWLHEPAPHQSTPIYSAQSGGGYLIRQTDPALQAYFRSYARAQYDADDGLEMDWQAANLASELFGSSCGCESTSEISTDANLRAAHQQMSAALTHRGGSHFLQVDNSLAPNQYEAQGLDMVDASVGVKGLSVEGEPENYGVLDPFYADLLDQIAYIDYRTSAFLVILSRGHAGAAYQPQSRRVTEATMLLGFSPHHLVDWAGLEEGSKSLAVWPEEGIYPSRPLESMGTPGGAGCLAGTGYLCTTGGHNGVEVTAGVYRREFRACYNQGVLFGRCAVVMNTRGSSVVVSGSWLRERYRHEITFRGGDVQSGGKLDLRGARFVAGSTSVPAQDAILLAG